MTDCLSAHGARPRSLRTPALERVGKEYNKQAVSDNLSRREVLFGVGCRSLSGSLQQSRRGLAVFYTDGQLPSGMIEAVPSPSVGTPRRPGLSPIRR